MVKKRPLNLIVNCPSFSLPFTSQRTHEGILVDSPLVQRPISVVLLVPCDSVSGLSFAHLRWFGAAAALSIYIYSPPKKSKTEKKKKETLLKILCMFIFFLSPAHPWSPKPQQSQLRAASSPSSTSGKNTLPPSLFPRFLSLSMFAITILAKELIFI